MLICRQRDQRRKAGTTALTALMLVPLLLVVAFAVDLNYVWRTDGELQDAADAAALAAAARLLVTGPAVAPGSSTPTQMQQMQLAASANAIATAQAYVQMHQAGNATLVVNGGDVQVGYIADPTAKENTPAGQFQTASSSFPNSVRVTVRRDSTVSTGPLPLFFGGMFGSPTTNCQATATATLRTGNVTGFNGSGSKLLPLAIDQATYNWLRGAGPAPPGMVAQDLYSVLSTSESGYASPKNVVNGGDNLGEGLIYPNSTTPGNFGLVSLRNSSSNTQTDYDNWITNGPSSADLASFGSTGLQASGTTPQAMYGGTGLKASLDGAFQSIIGKPRIMIVYASIGGNGANTQYQVVGFVGATVVQASLKGGTKSVTIQLNPTMDATATIAPGGAGYTQLVYSGVSLSR